MALNFHPHKDYESAVQWLEEREERKEREGRFHNRNGFRNLPPEEVARRLAEERLEKSETVFVRGCDPELSEPDLKKALTNHFSSCGEILELHLSEIHLSESVVYMRIDGEGAKEKLKQLDGSDLGGFKLNVKVIDLTSSPPTSDSNPDSLAMFQDIRTRCSGYVLPEFARRNLERLEKESIELSLNKFKKGNQAKK